MQLITLPLFLGFFSLTIFSAHADVETLVDETTGLIDWKLTEGVFSLELIQRLPDQTRAFFQARGFPKDIANDIGTQCVLQLIGKNTSTDKPGRSVSYDLKEWIVRTESQSQGLKLKEQWDAEWSETQVSSVARLAFRWSTFPTEQTFEPGGDYNWGMISVGLPPGSTFDLQVIWRQSNDYKSQWIKNIQCPEDR